MSIHRALSELAPNANWCMDGAQTYGNLQWNSNDITKPTELEVNNKIAEIEGVKSSEVEMTFDPPWTRDLMSEEAKLELGFL